MRALGLAFGLLLLLLAAPALAQQNVKQSGYITPGHAACWVQGGVIKDCGPSTAGASTEFGITKAGGFAFGINSAPTTGPYTQLSFGVNTGATASLNLNSFNGAAPGTLQFVVNGVVYPFPFAGPDFSQPITFGGNNTHNGTETFNNLAIFNNSLRVPIRVVTGAGAVSINSATDYMVVVNKTVGAATVVNYTCPVAAPGGANFTFLVKDGKGDAATNNITLTPAAGTIDGSSTKVMSTNFQALAVTCDNSGNSWVN